MTVSAWVKGALTLCVAALVACSPAPPPEKRGRGPELESAFSWIVTGDYPYGNEQVKNFPDLVRRINADPEVQLVFHVGDIKGAGDCSTRYFRTVKGLFEQFADPLIYTFGDNEWTDCSRADNGDYNPLERLATLRSVFFPRPGSTLGRPLEVTSQAAAGFPENITFVQDQVAFGVFHAVGSANGLRPWSGHRTTTVEQRAEASSRIEHAAALIRQTFRTARRAGSAAVVLLTQADMFPPGDEPLAEPGYQLIVRTLAAEAGNFNGEVYLFNGDSHAFHTDKPLSDHSDWPLAYRAPYAENVTRITIDGGARATTLLKVTTRPNGSPVLSWTAVEL